VSVASAPPASGTWGTYHALIIGINKYEKWPRLQTAVKDATVLRDTLVSRYGFENKNVILRTDKAASRRQIARDLRFLAQSMRKADNLLVYYAGHGQLDDFTGDGYWVPAEGALKDPETWVSNAFIKAVLSSEKLRAKNVVIIADSCYSGSMLRGGPSLMSLEDRRYREKLAEKASLQSRQVISSGGVEPVADGGAEGHSLFAFYLIDALRKNDREVIDLENLFHTRVWKPVTEIGDQRPNVGRLKTPMDQDGQFVLYNAAWAQEQARKQANLNAQRQQQAQEKAAVAAAELELQRQRFEMEKQKLVLEKEKLAMQKTLEVERLKLEKQKQEVEYAKLQARADELERKRLKNERLAKATAADLEKYRAAVDRKALDNKRPKINTYKLVLFPVKILQDWAGGWEETYQTNTVEAVQTISDDDHRLTFGYSYRGAEGISKRVEIMPDLATEKGASVWNKKSIFSQYEPDIERIKKASQQLDADLAVLVSIQFATTSRLDVFIYDYKEEKVYSIRNRTIAPNQSAGTIQSGIDRAIKKYFRNQ